MGSDMSVGCTLSGTVSLPLDVLFLYPQSLPDRKEFVMKKLSKAGAGRYTVKWIFTEPDIKKVLEEIRIKETTKGAVALCEASR